MLDSDPNTKGRYSAIICQYCELSYLIRCSTFRQLLKANVVNVVQIFSLSYSIEKFVDPEIVAIYCIIINIKYFLNYSFFSKLLTGNGFCVAATLFDVYQTYFLLSRIKFRMHEFDEKISIFSLWTIINSLIWFCLHSILRFY